MFLPGFMSDMAGAKAIALEDHCRRTGRAYVRFDYRGHGESEGRFEDGDIETWRDDALAVLDTLTTGPQVLVGSSMGGWLMLLVALARPERVGGLVGIAAAPDFTEELLPRDLTGAQLSEIETAGRTVVPSAYGDDYVFTRGLLEAGRRCLVMREDSIPIDAPVRLLHGLEDSAVPHDVSLRLQAKLRAPDVEVTLAKGGDHRLSTDADLDRLTRTLDALLARIG